MSSVPATSTELKNKLAMLLKAAETPFYLFTNIVDRIKMTHKQRSSIKYPRYPMIIDIGTDTPRDDDQTLEVTAQGLITSLEKMGKLDDLRAILNCYPG